MAEQIEQREEITSEEIKQNFDKRKNEVNQFINDLVDELTKAEKAVRSESGRLIDAKRFLEVAKERIEKNMPYELSVETEKLLQDLNNILNGLDVENEKTFIDAEEKILDLKGAIVEIQNRFNDKKANHQ
jgi:transcription initiation factor IIE alpha subunit